MGDKLAGQRAVITGGASGIGRGIATKFSDAGADVALIDIALDRLSDTADTLPGDTLELDCDIRSTSEVNATIREVVEAWGGIDILVNNAGVIVRKDLVDHTDEDIEHMMEINLVGAIRVARASIPSLKKTEGTMINISSIASVEGLPERSVYSVTKGGLKTLTHQLAVELAPTVRVNAIAPGTVDTSLNEEKHKDQEYIEHKLSTIPLNRLATPDDIADPTVFLASDDARYVTGHVLFVDGGRNAS